MKMYYGGFPVYIVSSCLPYYHIIQTDLKLQEYYWDFLEHNFCLKLHNCTYVVS